MAALESIGARREERGVLIARDLTIPARRCQSQSVHADLLRLRICIALNPLMPFLLGQACFTGKQVDAILEAPMAMTMNGEVQLAAPRQAVWDKLNDPEVLKACIPGCEELEKTDEHGFRATAKMKVGPVSARFKGKVTLSDLDPPNGYKISGEGEGGVAGFAKGGATVALAEQDGGTLLSYNVEAQIGGKLAQLGQRLINGSAKKLADEFFANFAKAVQG
jgi:uncharacterized protein